MEALQELRRQGRAWNHAPFDWTVTDGRFEPDQAEQATLVHARELRSAGMAYGRIAARLRADGRPTERGGPWSAMAVRSVLRTSGRLSTEKRNSGVGNGRNA